MLPPRLIRRLVLAPLVIILAVGFLVLSPFLALLALVFGLMARARAGHMRSLRLVGFALVWSVAETVALVMLAGLWGVSGFGGRLRTEPYQSRHYAVMRWFLDLMYRGAEGTYGLRVEVDEPEVTAAEAAARLTRPVIVLRGHAAAGGSFLLVHQLLSVYQRRPRVVMKATLQLDPSVDIVVTGCRTCSSSTSRPVRASSPGRSNGWPAGSIRTARWSSSLRAGTGRRTAGAGGSGGWSKGRRTWPAGPGHAELAPAPARRDPGGHLGLPDADVIFVAHAGLDNIITLGDVWGKFPINQVIRARWWRVPFEAVPRSAEQEAQVQWLYDWWEQIDTWISANRPGGATVLKVAPVPEDETAEPVGEYLNARAFAGMALMTGSRYRPGSARKMRATGKPLANGHTCLNYLPLVRSRCRSQDHTLVTCADDEAPGAHAAVVNRFQYSALVYTQNSSRASMLIHLRGHYRGFCRI